MSNAEKPGECTGEPKLEDSEKAESNSAIAERIAALGLESIRPELEALFLDLASEVLLRERACIVKWLRSIPEEVICDWGLNATAEIADTIESGAAEYRKEMSDAAE